MNPVLEIKQLTHVYSAGTSFEHVGVDHIDLSVAPGEFIGLIGHTGSGKSTLIQHMNGLLKPTSGEVLLDGENIHNSPESCRKARFRVGLVFQYPEYQLFEETVRKDISFGPKNMGLSEEEIAERVSKAAAFVGLSGDTLEKSPFDLSGGQKRRAAIAGVIAMEPEVLILDEPTAGLDPRGSGEILENIQNFRHSTGAAVIMVSHSMEEVAGCADRIVVLNKGRIFTEGVPGEVFSKAAELESVGLDIPQVTKLMLRIRELGGAVDPAVYTVEQAFKQLRGRLGGDRK